MATRSNVSKGRQLFFRYAALWLMPLAVVMALLLAEGLLRQFPELLPEEAQIRRLWQLQTNTKSIGDPYLGFLYPPYYRTEIVSLDFDFKIESDEHGFRNRSPWPDQADIVVVGDSLAYGWGVERDAAWTSLLDARLPESRVITLGLPGTAPPQFVRYFERFGLGLQPKVLIFGIFAGNDIVDANTFDRWITAGSPGNYDVWRFFEGRVPKRDAGFPRNSYLLLFLKSARKSLGQQYSAKTVRSADGEKLQLAPAILQRALEYNDPMNWGFKSVVQAVLAARNLTRDSGSELLVVLFPTKEGIYLPLHDVPFPTLVRPLKDVLEDEGITCIDLSERFRELAAQGKKLYFEIDGHPNELGNRVVADVLADYLRKNSERLGLEGAPAGIALDPG